MNIIETDFKWNNGLSRRSTTKLIVLHHAAAKSATVTQIDQWHKGNGWSGIGYHFYVRKDGSIYRGRPIWAVGSHAQGSNSNSIGICAEGNFDSETMPQAQKTAIKELLKYLKELYPNTTIKGHKETGATGCPGNNYPLDEMKQYYKNTNASTPTESEDKAMTNEERAKFNEMVKVLADMQKKLDEVANPMIYNYIDDNMPAWARPTIAKLVARGILQGDENGHLNLDDSMLRILVITDRAGAYDKE